MTDTELEILLKERVATLDLKRTASDTLNKILLENATDKSFLCGFERYEIKAIFERFEYQIERRSGGSIIRTRIGLYTDDQDQILPDRVERIGYYELETDFNGEVVDDWFVIEKEKR